MRVVFLLVALANLVRPLSSSAEITIGTKTYPNQADNPVSPAAKELVTQAVYRLANDPRLANHPIRRYLNDPSVLVEIIFDNPNNATGAGVRNGQMFLSSNEPFDAYLIIMIHEFIHIDTANKFCTNYNYYGFLSPEDCAFYLLMDEAFACALGEWCRLNYPEIPRNRQIRDYRLQNNVKSITDAMENDLRAEGQSNEQIETAVTSYIFESVLTKRSVYTTGAIPKNLSIIYGNYNTFLVPEYTAYRERGDAALRYMYNYFSSMMPFQLPTHMTYDYFRNRFTSDARSWAQNAEKPEDGILY